jgi:hypothetical protein
VDGARPDGKRATARDLNQACAKLASVPDIVRGSDQRSTIWCGRQEKDGDASWTSPMRPNVAVSAIQTTLALPVDRRVDRAKFDARAGAGRHEHKAPREQRCSVAATHTHYRQDVRPDESQQPDSGDGSKRTGRTSGLWHLGAD